MLLVPSRYIKEEKEVMNHKIATYDSSNIRLDTIEIKRKEFTFYLDRKTYFGKICGNYFDIRDFISSRTNLNSGELELVESSVTNNYNGDRVNEIPNNYIDPKGKIDFNFIKNPVYDFKYLNDFKVRYNKLEDNVGLPLTAYVFEDNFNMEYAQGIGNLISLVSGANISIPFRCDIIIDNIYGYNIKNINLLLKEDSDVQTIFKKQFKELGKSVKIISDRMIDEYKRLKNTGNLPDHIRIYCGIREFDTIIRAINVDFHETMIEFKINNSDHIRTLMTTMSSLGANYMTQESFGDLIDCNIKMTEPSMFLSEDYRENFLICRTADNYPASYK